MAYRLNVDKVATAFSAGSLMNAEECVTFEVREIGTLVVTSGAIAASDPLVLPNPAPFSERVPSGKHPVSIAIARYAAVDERIAFARVTFNRSSPVRWMLATTQGQDIETLGQDDYFGYGVDSGTGCFMDPKAGELLTRRMDEQTDFHDVITAGMDKTYEHTRSWLEFRPADDHAENVICFSSGFGDGSYPSFFGFDAAGNVSALVTDFLVLDDEESSAEDEHQPRRPWWHFWKTT